MKELKLIMTDEVFNAIQNAIGIKIMCESMTTISDDFVRGVVTAIKNGEKELSLEMK